MVVNRCGGGTRSSCAEDDHTGVAVHLDSANPQTWQWRIDAGPGLVFEASSQLADTRQRVYRDSSRGLIFCLLNAKNEASALCVREGHYLG